MLKNFFLIRHGESLGNIGVDSGADPTLSPSGHVQVCKCAEYISDLCGDGGVVYTSPLERCILTSKAIGDRTGMKIILEPLLHEYYSLSMGNIKYFKFDTISEKLKKFSYLEIGDGYEDEWWPRKSETQSDLELRVSLFRNSLLKGGEVIKNVVCVGHWCSIIALAKSFVPDIGMQFADNASVTCIKQEEGGGFYAEFINDKYE